MRNSWEKECRMCDKPLFWDTTVDSWVHSENRSIYCVEKASLATPKGKDEP